MFVSAVRETPLYEPVPWLAYWGQRFMMFTHGFGLVMAPTAADHARGRARLRLLGHPVQGQVSRSSPCTEPRVYYGEGSATMAFSNVHQMKELDYPTDQDRAEIFLPETEKTGRSHRLALEADRVRLAQRQVLGDRLLRPDQAEHARPLHPHAGRPAGARGAVSLLRLQSLRRRRRTAASSGSSTP